MAVLLLLLLVATVAVRARACLLASSLTVLQHKFMKPGGACSDRVFQCFSLADFGWR